MGRAVRLWVELGLGCMQVSGCEHVAGQSRARHWSEAFSEGRFPK